MSAPLLEIHGLIFLLMKCSFMLPDVQAQHWRCFFKAFHSWSLRWPNDGQLFVRLFLISFTVNLTFTTSEQVLNMVTVMWERGPSHHSFIFRGLCWLAMHWSTWVDPIDHGLVEGGRLSSCTTAWRMCLWHKKRSNQLICDNTGHTSPPLEFCPHHWSSPRPILRSSWVALISSNSPLVRKHFILCVLISACMGFSLLYLGHVSEHWTLCTFLVTCSSGIWHHCRRLSSFWIHVWIFCLRKTSCLIIMHTFI